MSDEFFSCDVDHKNDHDITDLSSSPSQTKQHIADCTADTLLHKLSSIPLPDKAPPSTAMLPRLARSLRGCGIISQDELDFVLNQLAVSELQAAHSLFSLWLAADTAGKRTHSERNTFAPAQSGLKPSTFRVDNFDLLMQGEQREVCDFLFDGFEHGFRLGRSESWEAVEFENGKMPSEEVRAELQTSIEADVAAGYILPRPHDGQKWQCSPIFMVPKTILGEETGAYRRITHFSKASARAPSVNETIPDELAAISYVSTADLQAMILDLHKQGHTEIVLGKIDLKNAYRLIPIHPDDWPSLGFADTQGRQFYETRLPFGLKQGCRLFSSLSNTISWALRAYGADNVDYIDDFAFANANPAEGDLAIEIANIVFALLGIPTSQSKEERCQPAMVFLGIEHDARSLVIRMPQARLNQLQRQLNDWLGRSEAVTHELMVLTGCLCSALKVIPQGKLFLQRCFAAMSYGRGVERLTRRSVQRWKRRKVSMSLDLQRDIRWWARMLTHCNGSVRMRMVAATPDVMVWTDASNYAMSGVCNGRFWQRLYDGPLSYLTAPRITIAAKEMMAVAISCAVWGREWSGRVVRFHCDNKGDVESFKRQANKNELTQHLMRVIALLAARANFSFELVWISTSENLVADAVSRFSISVLADRPECRGLTQQQIDTEWVPPMQDDPVWEDQYLEDILLGL